MRDEATFCRGVYVMECEEEKNQGINIFQDVLYNAKRAVLCPFTVVTVHL